VLNKYFFRKSTPNCGFVSYSHCGLQVSITSHLPVGGKSSASPLLQEAITKYIIVLIRALAIAYCNKNRGSRCIKRLFLPHCQCKQQ